MAHLRTKTRRPRAPALAVLAALGAIALLTPASPAGPVGEQRAKAAVTGDATAGTQQARPGRARHPGARRGAARTAFARRVAQRRARRTGGRRASARFALDGPRGTQVLRNRRYQPFGPTLDIYRRTGLAQPAPAVLVIHGGGWSGGGKGRMVQISHSLARAGIVAVNVGYTLAAPWAAGYPRQPAELASALRWVRRNATRLGVDRRRIGAFGSSAGGHLAALLALRARGSFDEPLLGAAVLWSAPTDLAALAGHRLLGPAATTLLGCVLEACQEAWAEASPIEAVSPGGPPMLVVNSRHEMVPASQAERFAGQLAAYGVPHELWLLDGHGHGRDYAPHALGRSISFLRDRLLR